jgi:hypothetical protein
LCVAGGEWEGLVSEALRDASGVNLSSSQCHIAILATAHLS